MRIATFLGLAFLLFLATPLRSQELVVNGGFETPTVGSSVCPNQGGWCYTASVNVPGWTVEWVSDGTPGLLEFWRGIIGGPHSVFQNVELDTHTRSDSRVRIYQDLATCPGGTYTLSYAYRPRPSVGSAQQLEVSWDGGVIANHGPFTNTPSSTSWSSTSGLQTATSGTTRVAFADIGYPNGYGILLDTVSVLGPNRLLPNGCTTINIKPNSDPNSINLSSGGVVPVTIWGSADFDVSMIDPSQLTFASASVKTVGKTARSLCSILDSGSPDTSQFDSIGVPDGYDDLTCHFTTQDIGTSLDDTSTFAEVKAVVCPNGYTSPCPIGSTQLTFSDSVNIVKE